ncbi:hypothetical protein PVE_R2G0877 [Pseudomonas veronii 1YdBTEX2]|uniref:Uncharacterized protein n=1 Tax=Pseudomonas veronii 1YdBTEX2 TaxID=1295141 RepID=A0A1D3K4W3_PSEVE|nr:hypothetical protein [Pseudomonas veronii]SBW83251.1 hypothetical protein PVE_R1G5370 [Pseudomonas veronii 1YdBTEX2]SBW84902.1 hypothetical protein PVE_R2G0877 [Pseudomonas veronii 1YdBTEX2]
MSIYRSRARAALASAQSELASNEDQHLKYAALELRMAIEAVTYDRASAYKSEFPPQEYETWQPKKVMAVLLEIDSTADSDSTISLGIEPSPGERPEVMHDLGKEVVFNLKAIKRHYDALGNFLHVPSIKQTLSGSLPGPEKIRNRCEEIARDLEEVLASKVFNSTLGIFSSFDCAECRVRIRKRMPRDKDQVIADCFECKASYTITRTSDGKFETETRTQEIPCPNPGCGHPAVIFPREVSEGEYWICEKCGGRNEFKLGILHHPAN